MPETPWGPDVLPHPLAEFATPATPGTWAFNDTGPISLAQTFSVAPEAWSVVWWGGPLSMMFDEDTLVWRGGLLGVG